MLVLLLADRLLDLVGLATILYLTVKVTRKASETLRRWRRQ